ncbi:MAG: GMC family oxidoreductase [Gammaproteobacteria bacterium]|nr:GMC family oxidoreductase [Gammaproteobacteria bacterium]
MILDAQKGFGYQPSRYDICIVGAGAAGISLALQFEATRLRICLLEAGGRVYERATQQLFEGEVAAERYPYLRDTRLGALGGTTSVWAGWCRPLDEIDFEPREWCGAVGWPFDLNQLQPYYERAHELCRLGALEYDPEYWEPVLGRHKLLPSDSTFTNQIFHVHAQHFGDCYYQKFQQSKNIDLVLHAPITRVGLDSARCKAEHVEVRTLDGYEIMIRADYFVLAAGGIENARLLLLSAVSPTEAPGNAHGLVGRYFNDHPFVDPGALIFRNTQRSLNFYFPKPVASTRGAASVRGALSLCREIIERERLMNAALFFYARYESHWVFETNEVKAFLQMWAKFRNRAVPGAVWPYFVRAARAPYRVAVAMAQKLTVGTGPAKRWRLRAMFETEFRYENRVMLSDEKDQLGRRRPRVEWQLSEQDLYSMSRVIHHFDQALRHAGVGHVERAFADEPSAWRRAAEGGKHHMGTTRMHLDPQYGVVDENSRVHGTWNLFVTGSSIFPSGGYANPTLTIVALATRLGDHIKRIVSV